MARPGWAFGCLWASLAVRRRARVPLVVVVDGRIGRQVLTLRTAEAVVLLFISQSGLQVLAVADAAAPEREIGLYALRL